MPDAPAKAEWRALPGRPRADPVDRHVGTKIRERRVMLGLSQQEVAGLLGVSLQQAHKYERGINRVTAASLHRIAGKLGVGVDYFFEGVGQAGEVSGPTPGQRLLLELTQHFVALPRPQQKVLCDLARTLAKPTAERSS